VVQLAVAGGAANALGDVDAVVEEDKIRRFMDAVPLQRFLFSITVPHRRQQGGAFPDLAVARHARFRWRQTGKGRLFHRRMAVTAVNPEAENVMLMAKWNRLFERNHLTRRPRRPIDIV